MYKQFLDYQHATINTNEIFSRMIDNLQEIAEILKEAFASRGVTTQNIYVDFDQQKSVVFINILWHKISFTTRCNFQPQALYRENGNHLFSGRIMRPVAESYKKQKQFITDAGHEIKTPLTIIGANTEVIEMQTGESEWTRGIKDQISHLASLTEKLIFLAKMEEQTDIPMFEFSLSDVVAESVQEFAAVAAAQNVELCCDIQKAVLYTGNEEMIRRMITLLTDNAIKYSDGKVVSFSLHADGNKRIIQVQNDASYMADGDLSCLFERFARGDASRNSGTGGHGIGLSVVQAIVSAHKGKIKAECANGKVVFTVIL